MSRKERARIAMDPEFMQDRRTVIVGHTLGSSACTLSRQCACARIAPRRAQSVISVRVHASLLPTFAQCRS